MNIELNFLPIILNSFIYLIEAIAFVSLTVILLLGAKYVWSYRKRREIAKVRKAEQDAINEKKNYRDAQEASAYEGFFEESYVAGFDNNGNEVWYRVLVPTAKAKEYYREMDKLVDEEIFLNTEEL